VQQHPQQRTRHCGCPRPTQPRAEEGLSFGLVCSSLGGWSGGTTINAAAPLLMPPAPCSRLVDVEIAKRPAPPSRPDVCLMLSSPGCHLLALSIR
jgi:hypothetical protein